VGKAGPVKGLLAVPNRPVFQYPQLGEVVGLMLSFDDIKVGDRVWDATRGGVTEWVIQGKGAGGFVSATSRWIYESGEWLENSYFRTELEALRHHKELLIAELQKVEDREIALRREIEGDDA